MPTETLNGIEIYYERRGSGPRLLFFNGSGSSLAMMGPVLDPFARRFDLLAHDQRGLGRTSVPPGPYTMADYAADAAALLDHVGWERCRVIGISFGGMVAQEFAVTWPGRVERLALLCTSPGGAGGSSYPLHELESLSQEDRATLTPLLFDTRFTPEWLASHPAEAMIVAGITGQSDVAQSDERRRGSAEQLNARRYHDVYDRLEKIRCPTLVAAGRCDGIARVANSEAIAARIPGAELRVYEGGHLFMIQEPKALPEVIDFLLGDG